jgi:hypothetical protein
MPAASEVISETSALRELLVFASHAIAAVR